MRLLKGKTRFLIITFCILFAALSIDSSAQNVQTQDKNENQKMDTFKGAGQPGFNPDIILRSGCGVPPSGNSGPALIINGILFSNKASFYIRRSNIKNIIVVNKQEVDATMKAVYGHHASNGLVLIETKNRSISRRIKKNFFNKIFRAKRLQNEHHVHTSSSYPIFEDV